MSHFCAILSNLCSTYQPSLSIFFLDLFLISLKHIVYIAKLPKPKWSICVNMAEPSSQQLPEV